MLCVSSNWLQVVVKQAKSRSSKLNLVNGSSQCLTSVWLQLTHEHGAPHLVGKDWVSL